MFFCMPQHSFCSNPYGNGTAIFTTNGSTARRFTNQIDVGQVYPRTMIKNSLNPRQKKLSLQMKRLLIDLSNYKKMAGLENWIIEYTLTLSPDRCQRPNSRSSAHDVIHRIKGIIPWRLSLLWQTGNNTNYGQSRYVKILKTKMKACLLEKKT